MSVEIAENSEALAARAAELFVEIAGEAIRERGRFTVALAGGRTPARAYALLSQSEYSSAVDWDSVYLFWGDERFVPHDDPSSNYAMAKGSLLDHTPIKPDHIFPIDTSLPTVEQAAEAYEKTLISFFTGEMPPRIDLILLGLGDDGHTASLFPGKPALMVTDRLVVATPPGTLPPPVDRVTMTFPVLNAARNIVFLVEGPNKAAPLQSILEGGATSETHPAAGVKPVDGSLIWLIDREAARLLAAVA